jgi:hypothetical protein
MMKIVYSRLFVLLLTSLTFSGCFLPQDQDDDFEPPPPPAAAQFIHQNPEQGQIEILFDEAVITTISFGQVSPAITLPQGDGTFSFRQAGAPSAFHTTELYTLENRVYTFALVPSSFGENEVILDLTQALPDPVEEQHWIRIVNLSDVNAGNLFRGEDPLLTLPLEENPSDFIGVEAASSTRISLTSEMGAPIKIAEGLSLPSMGASILLLSGSRSDGIDIKLIALDITRLSLEDPGSEVESAE